MAKKPNKYTKLIRYIVEQYINNPENEKFIDGVINEDWKGFFAALETALQSIEEDI